MAKMTFFVDLKEANDNEKSRIASRLQQLMAIVNGGYRPLTKDESAELALLQILNEDKIKIVDPLFIATRTLFDGTFKAAIPDEDDEGAFVDANGPVQINETIIGFVDIYGLLAADQVAPPRVKTDPAPPKAHLAGRPAGGFAANNTKVIVDESDPNFGSFSESFFRAVGEAERTPRLLLAVFPFLQEAGATDDRDDKDFNVRTLELAKVIRYLRDHKITDVVPQLGRRVTEALDSIQNVGQDQQPSDIPIDLPDLNDIDDRTIQPDNIRGLQPVYFAAMFEQLKVFQVVDKLVELFQNGILPINLGNAGNFLYKYWKDTPNRISEAERRNFYARAFGIPGGDDAGMPNREFNDLWLRFVSAVSSYIRQNQLDNLLKANIPGAVTQQQVRKAGRDLAANLSLYGYGMTYFAATDLQKQIKDVINLLSDPDIRQAYGARDMWQVIDQVAMLELGGAVNSIRYRTMASAGAIIMAWLANRAKRLSDSSFDAILDLTVIRYPVPAASGKKPTSDPTDADLVNACEQWLAVTGTEENQVEQYAQPRVSPAMTSKPIQIPSVARDVLESAGVSLPMGLGTGNGYAGGQHPFGYRR